MKKAALGAAFSTFTYRISICRSGTDARKVETPWLVYPNLAGIPSEFWLAVIEYDFDFILLGRVLVFFEEHFGVADRDCFVFHAKGDHVVEGLALDGGGIVLPVAPVASVEQIYNGFILGSVLRLIMGALHGWANDYGDCDYEEDCQPPIVQFF
jgi:hypothetical protein